MDSKKRNTISVQCQLKSAAYIEITRKMKARASRSKSKPSLYREFKPFNAFSVFCREIREKHSLKDKEITLDRLSSKWEKLTQEKIDHYIQLYQNELATFYRLQNKINKANAIENRDANCSDSKKRRSLSFSNEKKIKYNKMIYYYNPELNEKIIKSCQKIRSKTEMKNKSKRKGNKRYTQIIQPSVYKSSIGGKRSKKRKCFCGDCSDCLD